MLLMNGFMFHSVSTSDTEKKKKSQNVLEETVKMEIKICFYITTANLEKGKEPKQA